MVKPRHGPKEPVAEATVALSTFHGSSPELGELVAETEAGGYVAKSALRKLLVFASDPVARASVRASGASSAAAELLKRSSTDEANRALAGSLLSVLSGAPLAAEVSEEGSGAGGRIEIVVPRPSRVYGPDAAAMQLAAGVSPSELSA